MIDLITPSTIQRRLTLLIGLLLCGWLYCAAASQLLAEETPVLEVSVFPLYYESRSSTVTVLVDVSGAEAEQVFRGTIEVYHFENEEPNEAPVEADIGAFEIAASAEGQAEKKLSLVLEEPLQGRHQIEVKITEIIPTP